RAELRDPGGTLLASADNAAAGQVLLLSNVAIPADGIYSLRIKAAAAAATATGNYTVTVWDATPDVTALAFNSQYSRRIENPYHVDRWTFYGTAGQQVRFKLLSPSTSGLGFDLTGPGAWSGFTNLTTTSGPITLPASGDYTLSAHSIGGAYGDSYTFSLEQILQNPVAVGTPFTGRFTGSGQLQVFAFDVTGAMPLLLDLANSGVGNLVEVYVRFGALPTFGSYDERVTGLATSGQSILIPRAAVGTYYVMIHAPYVPTASDFTFTATLPSFAIRSTQFGTGGNAGNFTIHAKGAGFDRTLTAVLGNTGGFTRPALTNWFESETECYATFDLRGVAPGNYTVTFSKGLSAPVSVPNSLTVVAAVAPLPVIPRLTTPSATRRGREYSFTVEWENTTLNDALPPLLTVGNTVPFGLKSGDYSLGSRYTFLGINTQGGPAGILRAGQRETITFWAFSGTEAGTYTAFVDRNGKDPAAAFDWASLRPSLIPAGMTDAEFEPIFQRLISQVGPTWGDYQVMLSRNASLLPDSMGSARNIALLRDLDVRRAMGATGASIAGAILASTMDSDLVGQHLSDEGRIICLRTRGTGNLYHGAAQPHCHD
ncbi:MAG: hypothetical protein NTW21_42225, partial [Verrucomicrobia bacterium]|nr:hypothetical protein [Verrucomicrobiota bacterium]